MSKVQFHSCTILQLGEAFVYYRHTKELGGYLITSVNVADNAEARLNLAELLTYFFREIVKTDNAYCMLFLESQEIFRKHVRYYKEYNGISVFKVTNFGKNLQ